jgi:ketosteroid isomerase-like protein
MGTSGNKQIVTEYFSYLSAGGQQQALEIRAEDATWWVLSRASAAPASVRCGRLGSLKYSTI